MGEKIKEYRNRFIESLTPLYDAMEAENFFYLILEKLRNLKRVDVALQPELEFPADEIENWETIRSQLEQEIPIQYILGTTYFYGLEFEVNANVLIPRPETEELVAWIIKDNDFKGPVKIVDIGTGSGCIAISLAKNLSNASVSAIDVSTLALATAQRNATSNKVSVTFIETDILETESLGKFDVIVSNPPYVRNLEKAEIRKNVLDNEPYLALFVADDDALVFYRKIADLALVSLNENGKLYFEINQYLGKETVTLLENKGFKNVELRKDFYGNDRMICAET